ncbi:MAG TPA: glycoside hydrolase family 15 protein [Patescibacteria group bacterium]|jgi:GH15 family glucan-1,4-alpha-glucosidase|nr:glycoside hydrolase family 15 protein [Patescibacteria group bacterium]
MARSVLLSNGTMHVGINLYGMVHDFYYPHVGYENHAMAGHMRHRIGVWTEDHFSWLDDGKWQFNFDYEDQALIGRTQARNSDLGITIELQDAVDCDFNAFIRNIHVINEFNRPREIRLFLCQVFCISNSLNGETAQYLPDEPAILHYKGHRAFVIGATKSDNQPFDQFSIGVYGIEGREGTFRDAEDGVLAGNAVEHGSVDSAIGFNLDLEAHGSTRVQYWIAAGKDGHAARMLHKKIKTRGVIKRIEATQLYWDKWLRPAEHFISKLDTGLRAPFRKSLLLVKSHIDKHGAVMASTDTTVRNYSRDSYAYCWPRDASYALWPLLRLGYTEEIKNFFAFCRDGLHPDGYLMHKYQADGALGSSWLPYVYAGRHTPPIQSDETAIVLFLFGQYYQVTNDHETLQKFYTSLIHPAAAFLAECIDETTKLPHATFDIWEERLLTTTYTTAVTYAALLASAKMAEALGHNDDAVHWQAIADDIHSAAPKLYNEDKKFFYRGFIKKNTGTPEEEIMFDDTIDLASFYGAFMFGLFDLHDSRIESAYQTLKTVFKLDDSMPTPIPRYEHDQYRTVDPAGMGNPWFITTLWMAQYYMETDKLPLAKSTVEWVRDRMSSSGVLSEQIDPFNQTVIGVAPLCWSQAEFLNSVLDLTSDPHKIEPNDL